jgi:hypothetical protein
MKIKEEGFVALNRGDLKDTGLKTGSVPMAGLWHSCT